MKQTTIGILGGTGFVGQHLCNILANYPYDLRVFTRRPDLNRDLTVLPNLTLITANVNDPKQLAEGLKGCDVVINLVGILNQTRKNTFKKVHVELVKSLISICQQQGVQRLLHISALNANPNAPSEYLRTKGEAEQLLNQANGLHFHSTIFRPSVIFGPGDNFFNKFALLLKLSPGVMVLPCANSIYAPVFVDDVVQAIVASLNSKRTFGQTYPLCGPEVFSLKELVKITAYTLNKKCWIIGLGPKLSKLAAQILQYFPGKPLTPDNVLSASIPSVTQTSLPEFFNIEPLSIHSVLPQYLGPDALQDPFASFRKIPPQIKP
ncbi:MAG: complex I NDUFA9 subunit family protein [Legionellales bacterium]